MPNPLYIYHNMIILISLLKISSIDPKNVNYISILFYIVFVWIRLNKVN